MFFLWNGCKDVFLLRSVEVGWQLVDVDDFLSSFFVGLQLLLRVHYLKLVLNLVAFGINHLRASVHRSISLITMRVLLTLLPHAFFEEHIDFTLWC
jgi:hypothetical protein